MNTGYQVQALAQVKFTHERIWGIFVTNVLALSAAFAIAVLTCFHQPKIGMPIAFFGFLCGVAEVIITLTTPVSPPSTRKLRIAFYLLFVASFMFLISCGGAYIWRNLNNDKETTRKATKGT